MPELLRLRRHLNENSKGGSIASGFAAALAIIDSIDEIMCRMEDYESYLHDQQLFYVQDDDMSSLAHANVEQFIQEWIRNENFGLDYILKILLASTDYTLLQERLTSWKTENDARWAKIQADDALGDLDDHPF